MTIGNRIREARKKQGMTQEELAGKMFVTPQAVSQWERDLTIPSADKLAVLAAALHTSVNALAGDAEEVPDWTMLDSLFSAEHMYSRMTTLADTEHLTETRTALRFMRKAHDGQTRKPAFYSRARVPYIFHPLLMACHAHALGIKEDAILAVILLHDVSEDCRIQPEDLPCSETVREAVRLLTFSKDRMTKKSYFDAIAENRIAYMAKIIDRCNNISTMASSFERKKLIRYIKETETFVMPLVDIAKETIPEYVDAIFVIKYHMRSILESLKAMIMKENA